MIHVTALEGALCMKQILDSKTLVVNKEVY